MDISRQERNVFCQTDFPDESVTKLKMEDDQAVTCKVISTKYHPVHCFCWKHDSCQLFASPGRPPSPSSSYWNHENDNNDDVFLDNVQLPGTLEKHIFLNTLNV